MSEEERAQTGAARQPDPLPGQGLLILDVGCGADSQARAVWPGAAVTRLDLNPDVKPDVLADVRHMPAELAGRFDIVYARHVLEHVDYRDVFEVLAGWIGCLKPGGLLYLMVPSLEWAAEGIVRGTPSPALIPLLYGSQTDEWQFHRSGFTLLMLRHLFLALDLATRRAELRPFGIAIGGEVFQCAEIFIVGEAAEHRPACAQPACAGRRAGRRGDKDGHDNKGKPADADTAGAG